jgi:nucleoside-diphosphate-sugar epimerase
MNTSNTTVLVTGATGFIAQHCVVQLLDAGYRVRGTARSAERASKLKTSLVPHLADGADAIGRFEIVSADLTSDDGWADAVDGCRYVLHVASPIPRTPPKDENELIVPARDGALRVLAAAAQAGVERVVMTSSIAAVLYGRDRNHTFDESDWSDIDASSIGAYEKSKTIAERAAWEYVASLDEDHALELVTINPGVVLGPILDEDYGTSGEVVKKLFDRDFPACPDLNWAAVDVRDVAAAHITAMTTPAAAGERFICAIENHSIHEIACILDQHFSSRGFRIPTGKLPDFAMRLVALFDKTASLALNDLGVRQDLDNSKIKNVLGWQPRGLEEMVVAMGDSFIEYGVVTPKR